FLSGDDGAQILEIAEKADFLFSEVDELGKISEVSHYIDTHIEAVIALPLVNAELVSEAGLTVAVDAVNSTGGIAIPRLLKRMGVKVIELYCEPNGDFPHNPEPLKEHLTEICKLVKQENADLGVVVD